MLGFDTPWQRVCVNFRHTITQDRGETNFSAGCDTQISLSTHCCFASLHLHWPSWTRNVAAAGMEKAWNTVLVLCMWLCVPKVHHTWWKQTILVVKMWNNDTFSVLSVLLSNCFQAPLRRWCTSHRVVFENPLCAGFLEIGTDSYCTYCLHYSHCTHVTLLPGVIFTLDYQMSGDHAFKKNSNLPAGGWKC